ELGLQNQARTKCVHPTGAIIYSRIVGRRGKPWQSARVRRVVVQPAIPEPEEVLAAQRLIDTRGEFILRLNVRRSVDRVEISDADILEGRSDLLDKIHQSCIDQVGRDLIAGNGSRMNAPGVAGS